MYLMDIILPIRYGFKTEEQSGGKRNIQKKALVGQLITLILLLVLGSQFRKRNYVGKKERGGKRSY